MDTHKEKEVLIMLLIEKNPAWSPDEVLFMAREIIAIRKSSGGHA